MKALHRDDDDHSYNYEATECLSSIGSEINFACV